MTHVALLVSSLGRGGAERVAATLANAWSSSGHRVTVVCTFVGAVAPAYPLDGGVGIVAAGELPEVRQGRGPEYLRKLIGLRRLLRERRPDLVVSFLTNVNVSAILATRGVGIPVIVSERVDPAGSVELPWSLEVARQLLYPCADALVVQTPETAQSLRRRLFACPATHVVPNPLPRQLERDPSRAIHRGGAGRVVAFGRLSPQKGFDQLLAAFARAFAPSDPWTLEIFGDGPERERLDGLIRSLGLIERAFLRGATKDPWSEMRGAQLLALTSLYEGFPNVMLEGMAIGLPCVAYDCPAGPRFIAGSPAAAVIVRVGDIEGFAAELRRLARDPQARAELGAAAALRARSAFSESEVLSSWDHVIEACVPRTARDS